MKTTRRKSKQRELIYEMIAADKAHPTAQQVYDRLKSGLPMLSLGNVYRNIGILLEEKRLRSCEFGSGTVRYDAVTDGHYHFVCDACGGVSDMPMPLQAGITAVARKFSRHTINGHTIRFFGHCASCAGKQNGGKKKANKKQGDTNGTNQ